MALIDPRRKAPIFTLKDQYNKSHNLKDYLGRIVVLYFYPKDATTGCTNEACQFRELFPDFTKIKGVILGVSPDGAESHLRFASEHQLPFTLLSDSLVRGVPSVCDAYGVWQEKSMYGRRYMGVVRTTYLIDADGRVARRWDRVSVGGHAPEVLKAVKLLHSGESLLDMDGKPVRLPRIKHRKTTRTHDTDPTYTPLRGPGNKSSRGPSVRRVPLAAHKAHARRAVAAGGRKK
jgi:peroxiredoxin Q/BCP